MCYVVAIFKWKQIHFQMIHVLKKKKPSCYNPYVSTEELIAFSYFLSFHSSIVYFYNLLYFHIRFLKFRPKK